MLVSYSRCYSSTWEKAVRKQNDIESEGNESCMLLVSSMPSPGRGMNYYSEK